jgi:hypothetical protein
MGDPSQTATNVAKSAQSAWEVGAQLYGLYRDTNTSIVSLSSLATETMQLGNTCDELDRQIRKLLGRDLGSRDIKLFSIVERQRTECDQYLNELGGAVRNMRPEITSAMSRVVSNFSIYQMLNGQTL